MTPLMITSPAFKALDNEYAKVYAELQGIHYTQILPFGRPDDEVEYERLQKRLSEISRLLDEWRIIQEKTEKILTK